MSDFSPEQVKLMQDSQIRSSFRISFDTLFQSLIDCLKKIPMSDTFRSHCYMNLDQSAYWARQGIDNLQFSESNSDLKGSEETIKLTEIQGTVNSDESKPNVADFKEVEE